MNAELLEGPCSVQTSNNVLWKLAAVLIDILWQATLPLCRYKSSADSAVSGPLLYWLSHWSSLWSTKGMKKRKETSLASQHMLTHTQTHAICPSHYSLTLSCIYLSTYTHEIHKHVAAGTHCRVRGHTQPEATTQSFTVLQQWPLYCTSSYTRVTNTMWELAVTSYRHSELKHACVIHSMIECHCPFPWTG